MVGVISEQETPSARFWSDPGIKQKKQSPSSANEPFVHSSDPHIRHHRGDRLLSGAHVAAAGRRRQDRVGAQELLRLRE